MKNDVKKYKYCDFSGCDSCKKVRNKRFIHSNIYANGRICSICEVQIKKKEEDDVIPDDLPTMEIYDDNEEEVKFQEDNKSQVSETSMDKLIKDMEAERKSRMNSISKKINNKSVD